MPTPLTPLLLPLGLALFSGCDTPKTSTPPEFDAARAWKHLETQVAFGPRPAGSQALEKTRVFLMDTLRASGLKPVREEFSSPTPKGKLTFANVYADLPAQNPAAEWIILGSHFDTKHAEERFPEPFLGANDAGSSTAVLLELAHALARQGARELNYRFLFLDGEEAVLWDWAGDDNTYGSRHHAAELKKSGMAARVRAFILLDMVGDKDLQLMRDSYSDRRLLDMFFASGRELGYKRHVDGRAQEILDDHLSFMAVGIPSVDLIDLDYGPFNSFWHTPKDTLENCSQASLEVVGRIVLTTLPKVEKEFRRSR